MTEFAVLLATLLQMRLAAVYWGPQGFGEYVTARRVLGLIQLPLLCGVALGLTRYVSMAAGDRRVNQGAYFAAGLLIVAATGSVTLAVLSQSSGLAAFLFFGSRDYSDLVRSVSFCLPGTLLHGVAYGWLCGRLQTGRACALQFVNLGLVPTLVFALRGLDVAEALTILGVAWSAAAACFTISILWSNGAHSWQRHDVGRGGLVLLQYGAPRIPAEAVLGIYFALPSILAAHWKGLEAAGFIGVGVSVVRMIGALFTPLGPVLMPTASALGAAGRFDSLRNTILKITACSLAVCTVVVIGVEVMAPLLIRLYLGSSFSAAVPIVRITLLGTIPYCVYLVVRNLLDALRVMPLNGKNLLVALLVMILIAVGAPQREWCVPTAFGISLLVLGLMTGWDGVRLLRGNTGTSGVHIAPSFALHRKDSFRRESAPRCEAARTSLVSAKEALCAKRPDIAKVSPLMGENAENRL
jgi:O-antigen/teichoic acid export membrane protein